MLVIAAEHPIDETVKRLKAVLRFKESGFAGLLECQPEQVAALIDAYEEMRDAKGKAQAASVR